MLTAPVFRKFKVVFAAVTVITAGVGVLAPLHANAATTTSVPVTGDFNGDGSTDIGAFQASGGIWNIKGVETANWGISGDIAVPGDYNGDKKTDIAVYRPSNSTWYVKGIETVQWGNKGDIPVVGDFNGDGKTDIAVYRPSNSTWYVKGIETVQWGNKGDIPVVGDFNGDKKTDIAIFRPSTGTWYVKGIETVHYGQSGDVPVAADYNGDKKTDIAVFRPSNSTWYVNGIETEQWGAAGDKPVTADYNGDGKADLAVFRPSNSTWYVRSILTTTWDASTPNFAGGTASDASLIYSTKNASNNIVEKSSADGTTKTVLQTDSTTSSSPQLFPLTRTSADRRYSALAETSPGTFGTKFSFYELGTGKRMIFVSNLSLIAPNGSQTGADFSWGVNSNHFVVLGNDSAGNGHIEIYTLSTGQVVTLTPTNINTASSLAVAPSGAIAYSTQNGIYVIPAGSTTATFLDGGSAASYCDLGQLRARPGAGSQFSYSCLDLTTSISSVVVNQVGGLRSVVFEGSEGGNSAGAVNVTAADYAWSVDGKSLAVGNHKSTVINPTACTSTEQLTIQTVGVDANGSVSGSPVVVVTRPAVQQSTCGSSGPNANADLLAWSPDGKYIASGIDSSAFNQAAYTVLTAAPHSVAQIASPAQNLDW